MSTHPDHLWLGQMGRSLLLCGALMYGREAQAQVSLRVLDYNIHRDIGSASSELAAQPALAKVVNFLNPDVWTINELGGTDQDYSRTTAQNYLVSFIQTKLTIFGANPVLGTDFFVYVGTYTDGYSANAIVSRYPLLSTQSYSDAGSGYGSLRGLVFASVDVPGPNNVGIFTTHLKALSTDADAQKRQAEAEADRASVAGWLSGHAGAAAVLEGDFNETEDADDGHNWSGHTIGDTLGNGQIYHPITTLKQAGLLDPAPLSIKGDNDTISSTSPTARFDYLLYTGGALQFQNGMIFDTKQYTSTQLTALNTANGTNFVSGDSASASDHLPAFGIFTVVPEPAAGALSILGLICLGSLRKTKVCL